MFDKNELDKIVSDLTLQKRYFSSTRATATAAAAASAQGESSTTIKPAKSKKIAIFMCGPTASGKTSIKHIIAKQNKIDKFVNLDQDEVGRVLKKKYGEEDRDIVRKTTLFHLLPNVIQKKENVIVDRTCRDVTDTIKSMNLAKNAGYYIIVAFVYVDKEEGKRRLIDRNKKGRKVPIEVFEDIYNDYEKRIIKRYFAERKFPYNEIVLFDNSGEKPTPLLIKYNNKIKVTRGKEDMLFYGTTIKNIKSNLTKKKGGVKVSKKKIKRNTMKKRRR